jgi:hypothetical protein
MKRFGVGHSKSKYGSSKVEFKGMLFDSKYEVQRYIYLLGLQQQGKISGLRRQTPFLLIPKATKLVAKHLKTKVKYVERVVELQ